MCLHISLYNHVLWYFVTSLHLLTKFVYSLNAEHKCRITTMSVYGDLLYIGTGGGVLLALRCSTMELHFSFHAYNDAVRSLLLVSPEQQTKVFTRLLSRRPKPQANQHSANTHKSQEASQSSPLNNKRLHLNLKPMEPLPAERSVLISFGHGYRGVVGDSENCPPEFILPCIGKKAATKPAKPSKDNGHLLLWSTEHEIRHPNRISRIESSPSKLQSFDRVVS